MTIVFLWKMHDYTIKLKEKNCIQIMIKQKHTFARILKKVPVWQVVCQKKKQTQKQKYCLK